MDTPDLVTHRGGCHCGAVAFEVTAPARLVVQECNCSICRASGFWHLIVPRQRFHLRRGLDMLTEYTFGTGVARHLFCRACGVKSFYVPRSNPDGYSVNARCLDDTTIESITVEPFDGRNWEASAAALRHLTEA
jgi:centromere protein V